MNLTKLEKSIIVILVVGGILAAGIFLFVLPSYEKIGVADRNLKNMQKQQQELETKLAREATIDDEISDTKKDAEKIEVGFYPDLTTYETVEIVLAYLKECNLDTYGISTAPLSTNDLELIAYEPVDVIYDLKTYSRTARGTDENALLEGEFLDGGKKYSVSASSITDVTITNTETGETVEPSKYTETMKKAYKQAVCKTASDDKMKQVVGATSASFTIRGTYGDYLKFLDYIFGLQRATYMNTVIIPMTMEKENIEEVMGFDAEGNFTKEENSTTEVVVLEDDMDIEQDVVLTFLSVEPMKALETIDAAGQKIVVNQ